MKVFIYGMKDSDGICGNLCETSTKHFMAEHLKAFYDKVGKYQPVDWLIYGERETVGGAITLYETPEVFDWKKQLEDDFKKDMEDMNSGSNESSILAQEIENGGSNE